MNSFKTVFFVCVFCLHSDLVVAQTVANYTFSATNGAYAIIQSSPGSTSPTLSGGSWDDGWINSVPIGFTFVYEGVGYTTIAVSTNGWTKFGAPISNSGTLNNISTGTVRPMVAPLWDDIMLPANGFTYITTGVAPNRVCTLEWYNARWNYAASAGGISFQVKLYESNKRVEFVYRQEGGLLTSPSASIGIGGVLSGQYISLNSTGPAPLPSTTFETTSLNTKPVTGQIYRFDHYSVIPVITSISPVTGIVSSLITITGSGFEASPLLNIAYCGDVKGQVISATTTQLIVVVPRGTTFKNITVTSLFSNLTAQAQQMYDVQYGCGGFINSTSFAPGVDFSTAIGSRHVELCDIDGDGKLDVAASTDNGVGTIRIFRNTAVTGTINTGSLSAGVDFATSAGQPGKFCFEDLDGDGKKEMLSADYSTMGQDSIAVFRNTSTIGTINASTFAPRVNYKVGNYPSIDAADIDGDGQPEMLIACRTSNQLILKQNNCSVGTINAGTFGANVIFATANGPNKVAGHDLDGDGKIDIVLGNSAGNSISVFRNTSTVGTINTSSLGARVDYASAATVLDIILADMDGDGKTDVVASNQGGPMAFSVFRNTSTPGTISFATRTDFPTTFNGTEADVADIDGDGKPDVVISLQSGTNVGVYKNLSSVGLLNFQIGSMFSGGINPYAITAGDIDGDSKPELLVSNLSGAGFGTVTVLHNTTSSFSTIAPATVINATPFCDNGTWKTYCNPANNTQVLFAVKDNGNSLGAITVNEYRDAAPGLYNVQYYLQRHFKITPTNQPATPVQVRLYFTNTELTNLMGVDPGITGVGSLSVTKYNGPTEDGIYNPSDATSLLWYPPGSMITGVGFGGQYLEFTTNSFSEFWIHGGAGVLPIELISFEAHPVDQHVELIWETASENNNDFFVVEKTQDGTTIHAVDTMDGAGNSTTNLTYACDDLRPFAGSSYYRLKQIDFNGEYSYSEWREVSFIGIEKVDIFPNPTDGDITITLPGEYEVHWELRINDMNGQLVYARNGPKWDMQKQSLDLADGTYVMHLASESTEYCQKIVMVN